jgi:parallel beta-helix repeat protein
MKDQSIQSRSNTAPFRLTAMAVLLGVASFGAHAAQTVTLTSNLAAVTVGQSITLTAKANNGLGTALKGPITFTDGANQVPGSPVNAVNSTATLTVSPITSVGVHNFAAAYTFTGLVSSKPVASAVLPVTVNKAVPTVALGALPAATVGSAVDVSAQLGGGYQAGGVVTITDTTANTSVQGTLDASGKATVRMTFATPGTHSLKAAYAGDANNASAVSAAAALTAKNAISINMASDAAIRWVGSSSVGLVATFSAAPPAGSVVKFMDSVNGATPVQLGANVTVNASRQAKATVALTGVGKHVITAVYAGDSVTNAATSAAVSVAAVAKLSADAATSGYTNKVYVDVAAPTCAPSATLVCGTSDNPYRNLPQAFAALVPDTELVIAGRDGFAYYSLDDGALPAVSQQHTLVLRKPNFPGPNTVQMPVGDGTFYDSVDVLKPASQPAMKPTLIRQWAGTGLGRPVVRGTAKVSGWQAVPGSVPNLYSVVWNTKAEGLDAYQDAATGAWKFPTTVRPQQVYREPAVVSGQATVLEQVGGVLFNEGKYVSPPLDGDPALAPWPEKGVRQRPIGRVPTQGSQPWLNLAPDQFYVDAPLLPDGSGNIDKAKPVTVYVRLSSPLSQGEALEVSLQQFLLDTCSVGQGCAANMTLKDLIFERSNGNGYSMQNTAVTFAGEKMVMDNVTVRRGDAICLTMFGQTITLKNSVIEYCGQTGLTASGSGHAIDNNKVRYNNAKGFNENWAAGGMKFISPQRLTQSTVTNNEVSFNDGSGIWLDTTVDTVTISGNTIGMNGRVVSDMDKGEGGVAGFGVHLEAVDNNKVLNNTIVANANSGIHLIGQASTISGNFIAANLGSGISRPADSRLPCPSSVATGNLVTGNDFAWNDEVVRNPRDPANPTVVQGINFITLARMAGDVSDNNRYCGSNLGFVNQVPMASSASACGFVYQGSSWYGLPSWRTASSQDSASVSGTLVFDPAVVTKVKNRDAAFWATVVSGAFKTQTNASCAPLLKP